MDQDVTYQDLEPMIEAELYDPLPEGLVEPESFDLPEIEPQWLELPEIEQDWLELPEIEPEWFQAVEQGRSLNTSLKLPRWNKDLTWSTEP